MAYRANFATSGDNGGGGGPRMNLGTDQDHTAYFVVGAYDNINNIDTKNRPLKVHSGEQGGVIHMFISDLPDASTAPYGADLENIVVDRATGQLYRQ